MAKFAITILIFRIIQLALGLAFLVFWTWSCAAKYTVSGGAGEYFLGYFTSLASLAVCAHGIWAFARKHHNIKHRQLYHNTRWAVDFTVVCLWLGFILIDTLLPVSDEDSTRALNGVDLPSSDDIKYVVSLGAGEAELFSAITFFMTGLLLIIPAVKAKKTTKTPVGTV